MTGNCISRNDFGIDGFRREDITSYTLEECERLNIPPDIIRAIIDQILSGTHQATLKPIDGAVEVLGRILGCRSPLVFVTARPYADFISGWVRRTLELSADQADIIATGSFEAKATILHDRRIDFFVEDRLETCFLLHEAGLKPILFKQPWNRREHPFPEVGNWRELEEMIGF